MNKSIFIGAGLILCSSASLACNFNVAQLPLNTEIALSQTIFDFIIADPAVGAVIINARDEWDSTDAVDRVGNWNGVVTASDCPATSGVMQIGALAFDTSNCQTLINYRAYGLGAIVDLFDTRSITINLNFPWSLSPLAGQLDIQSMLTHEFGHVLGLAHQMTNGTCGPELTSCVTSPNQATMSSSLVLGSSETCQRTLETVDIDSANDFY